MWVYFIQNTVSGAIKIGISGDPVRRMESLQIGTPDRLSLLGAVPGDAARERELHRRFARLRLGGEWFQGEPELVNAIASFTEAGVGAFGTVWDECQRRGGCRYGLHEVEVRIEGVPHPIGVSHTSWDRDGILILTLAGGLKVPATECRLATPWPIVCCKPTLAGVA